MAQEKKEFKHLMRVSNTDLIGEKPLIESLRKIKGVSEMFANAICILAGVDKKQVTGEMSQEDVKKIEAVLADPSAFGCPSWLFNRQKDMETGEDKHLTGANLSFTKDNDIKTMRRTKSYKGVRHASGLTVRGQRTKSNFRKKKGKGLGVKRKK